MNADGKIFGMTRMQVGVLSGLAGALLLIVCCGGWFILGNGGGNLNFSSEPPAVSTSTPEPTVTPVIATTPTLVPTITPTPIPYEQLIPKDWKQYKTALVELWLPSNFKLADKKPDKKSVGKAELAVTELSIMEVPSKSSAYNMVVGVSYDLMAGDSFDTYLDGKLTNLPDTARVADRKTVFVNSLEARRLVIEIRAGLITVNDLVYVFLDGNTVWYVEYAGEISEFFQNLPVFEQSVNTFRVVR